MDLEEQYLPEQSPSVQEAERAVELMDSKPKRKKWKLGLCILLAAAALALLFAVWIYPAILHQQMQGKWYQKVIEGDKSSLLMLSIDEDTIEYYLCIEPNVLLGDTDALLISSPDTYSLKPFGKVEIRYGTASYEQSKYDVFIWGDSMKMTPGFGGMGEEWSRYSNQAYYFPESSSAGMEDVSSSAVVSSEPPVSSAVSSRTVDLKTDDFSLLTADQFQERFNAMRPEGISELVFKQKYEITKMYTTTYLYDFEDGIEVSISENSSNSRIKDISIANIDVTDPKYIKMFALAGRPSLSDSELNYLLKIKEDKKQKGLGGTMYLLTENKDIGNYDLLIVSSNNMF